MKTFSRQQLYANGEPFGDSATRKLVTGKRIYGGGGSGGGDSGASEADNPMLARLRSMQAGSLEGMNRISLGYEDPDTKQWVDGFLPTSMNQLGYMANEANDGTLGERLAGMASVDANRSISTGLDASRRNLERFGSVLNPNALAAQSQDAGLRGASLRTNAMNQSRMGAEDLAWGRNQSIASMASGQGAQAVSGLGSMSGQIAGEAMQRSQMDAQSQQGLGMMGAYAMGKAFADGGEVKLASGGRPAGYSPVSAKPVSGGTSTPDYSGDMAAHQQWLADKEAYDRGQFLTNLRGKPGDRFGIPNGELGAISGMPYMMMRKMGDDQAFKFYQNGQAAGIFNPVGQEHADGGEVRLASGGMPAPYRPVSFNGMPQWDFSSSPADPAEPGLVQNIAGVAMPVIGSKMAADAMAKIGFDAPKQAIDGAMQGVKDGYALRNFDPVAAQEQVNSLVIPDETRTLLNDEVGRLQGLQEGADGAVMDGVPWLSAGKALVDIASGKDPGKAVGSAAAGYAGAQIGQALIPIPGVGAAIGGLLGGMFFEDGGNVGLRRNMEMGGPVEGPGTTTSDSIPARLSDGEAVVNARAMELPHKVTKKIVADWMKSGGDAGDLVLAINNRGLEKRYGKEKAQANPRYEGDLSTGKQYNKGGLVRKGC